MFESQSDEKRNRAVSLNRTDICGVSNQSQTTKRGGTRRRSYAAADGATAKSSSLIKSILLSTGFIHAFSITSASSENDREASLHRMKFNTDLRPRDVVEHVKTRVRMTTSEERALFKYVSRNIARCCPNVPRNMAEFVIPDELKQLQNMATSAIQIF